jgi:hypothetical protein
MPELVRQLDEGALGRPWLARTLIGSLLISVLNNALREGQGERHIRLGWRAPIYGRQFSDFGPGRVSPPAGGAMPRLFSRQ